MSTTKSFLTKDGYDKLLAELRELREDKLPSVLLRLKEAIGQGDISENSEYESALAEKDLVESRIRELDEFLQNVEIIEEGVKSKEIRYGSKVKFKDDKGKEFTYTLVGTGEVDILNGTISFDSPIGAALKGKKKGDKANVRAPKGKYEIEVLDVK